MSVHSAGYSLICDLIGLVHIADLDLLISQVVALNAEGLSDFFQLLIHIHERCPPSFLFRKRPSRPARGLF